MSNAGYSTITFYVDHEPIRWRLREAEDDGGQVQLYGHNDAGSLCLYADPADVLRELDAARQLVIDHLAETAGGEPETTGRITFAALTQRQAAVR